MAAAQSWFGEMRQMFVGNAASVRDFRVQMRGSKAVWVFTTFVFLFGLFGASMYGTTLGRGSSLAAMQGELHEFYLAVSAMLGGAICLIAPCLTATTIVAERQRQSLDLVLCSPVKPHYLLIGKMIGSYRYIWMLLFLALPIVAMSVVLGGATWVDVFGSFLLLSFDALIFTSLALLLSTSVAKPAAAVFWSLMGVGFYVIVVSILGAVPSARMMFGGGKHALFLVALNPFTSSSAVSTSTALFGHDVPNWILAGLFCILLTRLLITTAASSLAPLDTKLIANARISGAIYIFLIAILVGTTFGTTLGSIPSSSSGSVFSGHSSDVNVMRVCFGTYFWLLLTMPIMACFGPDGSRRYWPNGFFRVRHTFDGTPSGGLPFALLIFGLVYAGVLLGLKSTIPISLHLGTLYGILWGTGMLAFSWSIGQYMSSMCSSVRTARFLHLTIILGLYLLMPLVLLELGVPAPGAFDPATGLTPLWYGSPFVVVYSDVGFAAAAPTGIVLSILALVLAFAAKRRLAPKLRSPL